MAMPDMPRVPSGTRAQKRLRRDTSSPWIVSADLQSQALDIRWYTGPKSRLLAVVTLTIDRYGMGMDHLWNPHRRS